MWTECCMWSHCVHYIRSLYNWRCDCWQLINRDWWRTVSNWQILRERMSVFSKFVVSSTLTSISPVEGLTCKDSWAKINVLDWLWEVLGWENVVKICSIWSSLGGCSIPLFLRLCMFLWRGSWLLLKFCYFSSVFFLPICFFCPIPFFCLYLFLFLFFRCLLVF